MKKLILPMIAVLVLSACQSTANLEVEYIKARNQALHECSEAMKAQNQYSYQSRILKHRSRMLQAELERLVLLDEALQRAILNSNCPVEI